MAGYYEPDYSDATNEDKYGDGTKPLPVNMALTGAAAVRAEIKPVCVKCHSMGEELLMRLLGNPEEDPTYNHKNGHMICDKCWTIKDGLGKATLRTP